MERIKADFNPAASPVATASPSAAAAFGSGAGLPAPGLTPASAHAGTVELRLDSGVSLSGSPFGPIPPPG